MDTNFSLEMIERQLQELEDNYLDIAKYYGEDAALRRYQDLTRQIQQLKIIDNKYE